MKTIKSILAFSLLGTSLQTQAAIYHVVGKLDGINTVNATVNPQLYLHSGSTVYDATGTQWPTFAGTWDVSSANLSGVFADFAQFSTSINAGALGGTAVVYQPNLVYSFNGGTVAYDAATRTLTLGQPMIWSDIDAGFPSGQTSDASLKFGSSEGAVPGSCSGSQLICEGQQTHFLDKPNLERFYLTLTFNANFTGFTGTAVGVDIGGPTAAGATGNTWYHYSFSAVPVPGAVWLLGSGLAGLAAAARRRRGTAS